MKDEESAGSPPTGSGKVHGMQMVDTLTALLAGASPLAESTQSVVPGIRADGDAALLARIAGGDHDAFAAVVREHERWARTLALRMLGSIDEAEDAVQDAFLNLWTGAPRMKWQGSLRTCLSVMVTRRCLDRLRRRGREVHDVELDARPAPEPERPPVDEHDMARLRTAVGELPDRQRAAIVLFHVEELSLKEGADAMELSPKAFESLLIRARRSLRKVLKP